MTKNKSIALIVLLALLGVFNIVFFTVPSDKNPIFWISYAFGMLAIITQIFICILAWGKATTLKSKFMGVPILLVAYTYLIVQMLSSALFLILSILKINLPFYIPTIINAIILVLAIIPISLIEVARDEINSVEEKVAAKVLYIKALQSDIDILISRVDNNELKKLISNLSDTIKYSDPMSNTELGSIENQISDCVSELKESVTIHDYDLARNLIQTATELLQERNSKCKLLK